MSDMGFVRGCRGNPRDLVAFLRLAASGVVPLSTGDVRILWRIAAGEEREAIREASELCGKGLLLRELAQAGWLMPGNRLGEITEASLTAIRLASFAYGAPVVVRADGSGGATGLWLPTVWRPARPWAVLEFPADGSLWVRLYVHGKLRRKRRIRYWG